MSPARRLAVLVFMLVAAAPGGALAQEDEKPPGPGEEMISTTTNFGVSGVRTLVDARIPPRSMLRGALRALYQTESEKSATLEHTTETYIGGLTLSTALFGHLEGGFFAPFYTSKETTDHTFGQGTKTTFTPWITHGSVGAKAGGSLDWISPDAKWLALSPYVFTHLSDSRGVKRYEGYQVLEAGFAEGVSFLEDQLAFNVDTAFVSLNGGKRGFRYRVGAMLVPPPLATRDFVPRLTFYLDGLEHAGSRGSDLRVAASLQTLLFETVALDLNGEYRVYAGSLPAGLSDGTSGGLTFSAGVGARF